MSESVESTDSLYDILGVSKDASQEDIRKAYKDKAKTAHPDTGGSKEEFSGLNLAYTILSDSKKRLEYDSTGKTDYHRDDLVTTAIREIQSVMQKILHQSDDEIFYVDVLAFAAAQINLNIECCKNTIKGLYTKIKRIKRYKKKFKKKNKKDKLPDYLVQSLDIAILQHKSEIDSEAHKVLLFKKMLELLSDYQYIPESKDINVSIQTTVMGA